MAKLVDARDLKSLGRQRPCRFESDPRHHGHSKFPRLRNHLERIAIPVWTHPGPRCPTAMGGCPVGCLEGSMPRGPGPTAMVDKPLSGPRCRWGILDL